MTRPARTENAAVQAITEEQLPLDSELLSPSEYEELEEAENDVQPVSYSGTDFDVEGIVRRLERGDIVIPTFGHDVVEIETARFQRSFVWRRPQMDKFIESLLLEFPIPGIILVQQADKRYLVLDGQQRLRTLAAFYEGIHAEKQFALNNVAERFQGLTYKSLSPERRRTLDNTFIQATIVRTDGSPDSLDAVYQVFERLNSGGTQLTPHEIRIALYAGPFVEFLARLNEYSSWRELYGPPSPRLRDQELLLRTIALYASPATYKRPLKQYLNDFVGEHRTLARLEHERIAGQFRQVTDLINEGPGRSALRLGSNQVNAALSEAILVGLMRRLESGDLPTPDEAASVVSSLTGDAEFVAAVNRATADEENVRTRLAKATRAFAAA